MASFFRAAPLRAAALLLFLVLGVGCSQDAASDRPDRRLAPDFTLTAVDGNTVQLSKYRGQVVLLDFWATWCPPCRAGMPHNMKLQESYGPKGFAVLGLSLDKNPEDVDEYLEREPVNFPMMILDDATRQAYGGIPTVPYAVLIDRSGRIRQKKMGFSQEIAENMERAIARLVNEGTSVPYGP